MGDKTLVWKYNTARRRLHCSLVEPAPLDRRCNVFVTAKSDEEFLVILAKGSLNKRDSAATDRT